MRIFASIFLLLFFVDGAISCIDEVVSVLFQVSALSIVRNIIADFVILLAIPTYLSLAIDRRLPKWVMLPLIFFVFWCPLSVMLFPSLGDNRAYGMIMSAGQLVLCLVTLFRIRKAGGSGLIMPKAMFDRPLFSLKNTLVFCAANVFVVPLVLVLLVLGVVNSYMNTCTAGFMHLAPDGLRMAERVYQRGGKTIRLAAMIHVGEKEYYDELTKSVAPGRTIVLAEGVSDHNNLLQESLDYGKVAGFLGLTSQATMRFKGRQIEEDELQRPVAVGMKEEGQDVNAADILRADVDVSAFHPQTIRFLDMFAKYLKENSSVGQGMVSFNSWAGQHITPEVHGIIMDDILHARNRELIRHLRKAVGCYDTVVIPWGALHMPEIEHEVLEQGFVLRQKRERVSIRFRKMMEGFL